MLLDNSKKTVTLCFYQNKVAVRSFSRSQGVFVFSVTAWGHEILKFVLIGLARLCPNEYHSHFQGAF